MPGPGTRKCATPGSWQPRCYFVSWPWKPTVQLGTTVQQAESQPETRQRLKHARKIHQNWQGFMTIENRYTAASFFAAWWNSEAKNSHTIIRSFTVTAYLSVMNSDGAKWNERKHWSEHVVDHHHPITHSSVGQHHMTMGLGYGSKPAAVVRVSLPKSCVFPLTSCLRLSFFQHLQNGPWWSCEAKLGRRDVGASIQYCAWVGVVA